MTKFFINILILFLLLLLVGEIVVRLTHAVSDIPERTIDEYGIQKYNPNQYGYWKGGEHNWIINRLGWPGELPKSFDNLILIVGDSFIENFMNPNECHQSAFLKRNLPNYNFLEAARSGVSLIEAMEISKHFDSLQPIKTLIYVNDGDFYESVTEIKSMKDITQLDLKTKKIRYGEMKAPLLKKALYNWKLMYYFYNRFYADINGNTETEPQNPIKNVTDGYLKDKTEIIQLLEFIKNNYDTDNKILVFNPNSDPRIIELVNEMNLNAIILNSEGDDSWTFTYDSHWTCYGHECAARGVSEKLVDVLN